MNYVELIEAARRTNRERDAVDREVGFASPSDVSPAELLRTAMTAICAGISRDDWSCIAEGQAMLYDLHALVSNPIPDYLMEKSI